MSRTILSIVLGIGGMFGWGIYDFLGAVYSKNIGSFKSLFWSQSAGLISIFLLAFVFGTVTSIPILVLILFPIAAIIYSFGYLLFFKGFEKGNVSIIAAGSAAPRVPEVPPAAPPSSSIRCPPR